MRKVVTGEQVAQIYNRDPFALPIWRAPVYQTPAIFTIVVQLYRLHLLAGPADRPAPAGRQHPGGAGARLGQSQAGSAWSSWWPGPW